MTERMIYSVSQLNNQIKQLLEGELNQIWLEGEISNFKHHSSGHMYFSLKDAESEIRSVMWRGLNQSLRFLPEDGLRVLVSGDVSVYTPRGQYQIVVNQIQPAGQGDLQLAFEQLKERLRGEGLFDTARKRSLPPYPMTIGVVTSETGAAFRDILNVLQRRASYVKVILAPARVQGDGAAQEIVGGIERLNRSGECDVIIIGRGGGSLEDLWPFNEEIVARAVVTSDLPVISAVGHEVDFSISDFSADYRAPTPSAAAEIVARDTRELDAELEGFTGFFREKLTGKIEQMKARYQHLIHHYAFKIPKQRLLIATQRLDEIQSRLETTAITRLKTVSKETENLTQQLYLLHPDHILQRGYSITRDDQGNILRSSAELDIGETIHTRFANGNAQSKILVTEESNGKE